MRNIGKISETVLKRSVIKPIRQSKTGVDEGVSVGADCAFFVHNCTLSVAQISYNDRKACEHVIIQACNNLWAGGAKPGYISLSISMPDSYREIKLKEIMNQACKTAEMLDVRIAAGHTEYVGGLRYPIIVVNAYGEKVASDRMQQKAGEEYDIVMTKWIGLSGASLLATEKEEECKKKLPEYYVKEAASYDRFMSIATEAAVAVKSEGTIAMHDVAGGGIYTALWEMGEKLGLGCRVLLKDIPVLQEVVEICEVFDINPYRLRGDGALLIATSQADKLTEALHNEDIPACVIGKMTACIDRVIIREDETRFLEPANGDDIIKVMW